MTLRRRIFRRLSSLLKDVPSDMGNKPSVSEGEDEEERHAGAAAHGGGARTPGVEITNGGGEDADEELELPPPMKPIQEPILVTSPPPGVPDIEENPCKREQHSENQERNSLLRDAKSADAISDYAHRELSAQCSSNEATALAFSGDESDKPSEESSEESLQKKKENLLKKREFVLKELIDTEEAYVENLKEIVEDYMRTMADPECEIPIPEDLRNGKDKMVFGNIEAIYEWHKE
ncbi:unnamed protein product [Brassicogethes aeneus]|uniref:DH domain-containing protein n=1 Tax=Brassicogethes aeneus TaxID=1431903 RepID=A0A9P0ATY6_BRAAE|nr:unnamed protein product [Brassicogethes aeneus]